MSKLECDVCVTGGGPAGAVAALHLARLGYHVCLFERQSFPRPHVGESLSPGIWPLLDSLGLRGLVERASFRVPGETLLCWAEPRPHRVSSGAKAGGLLVERGALDSLLLEAAQRAGVRIIQPARATASRTTEGWRVEAQTAESVSIVARRLVDAAGRTGCLGGRRIPFAPATLALWGHLGVDADSATRVEAIPDGWLWAAPIADRRISVMLFCDPPDERSRASSRDSERFLRERLAETVLFSTWARASFVLEVVRRNATCAYAAEPIGAGYVKIGEANCSLDPLASTGVEKALQTALVGAVVTHTLLQHPERADLCVQFFNDRQQEIVATHTEWASRYYREVERYADKPFWAARRGLPASGLTPAARIPEATIAPKSATPVQLAPDVSIIEEPCIVGETIDIRRALCSLTLSRPLVFLDGIEVVPLLADISHSPTWRELLARWSERLPSSRAERFATWLWEKRVLCEASTERAIPSARRAVYARTAGNAIPQKNEAGEYTTSQP